MRIPDVLGSSMLKPEPKGRDHGKLGRHDGSLERMCVCLWTCRSAACSKTS